MSKQNTLERPDIEIRVWMMRNGLTMTDIGESYGAGYRFVSQFVRGIKTSKGLEKFMVDMGCPAEYFDRGRVRMAVN